MLFQLGRGMRAHHAKPMPTLISKSFLFTNMLPTEFTYTRSDSAATIRDNSGIWRSSALNTPRFDHDEIGRPLGMRVEPPRINKVNHHNFSPTTIGDIAVISGNGSAFIIDDSAKLASATIDGATYTHLQNGNAIALTGGSTGTTYRLSIGCSNTNPHAFRIVARTAATGYNGSVKLSDGAGQQTWPNDLNYNEIISEDLIPNAVGRYLSAYVTAGNTVYITAAQFEEGAFITTPIITTSVSGTTQRGREVCVATGLENVNWFNSAHGAIVGAFVFDHLTGFDQQYAFLASEGAGLSNTMGMYINEGASQMRARDITASTNNQNGDIHKPITGKRFPCAMSWKDGESYAIAGAMTYNHVLRAGSPSGMDRLYIGGRPFTNAMSGWVQSLTVFNQCPDIEQIGAVMFPPASGTYKAIGLGGQSNMRGKSRDTNTQMNGGEIAAVSEMDAIWSASENWLMNGAVDGSALIPEYNAVDYWIEGVEGADGPALARWKIMASAFGTGNIPAIHWDQGAADRGDDYADFFSNTLEVLTRMRNHLGGNVPVIINPIAARADQTANNYNMVKRVHEDLAAATTWITLAPPQNNVNFGTDNIHLSDASYTEMSAIQMRKILSVLGEGVSGAVDAPAILSASRSGTTITAPVTLPSGISAIAPTSAIAGFRFFDNGAEIAITAANYAGGVITLELASTPSGTQELYFGYGSMYTEIANAANFPRGNDAYGLGLQNMVVAVV